MKTLLTSLFIVLFVTVSFSQKLEKGKEYNVTLVGFYNLENLFDTIADPDTNKILQDEYTPEGKNNWNTEKYLSKLNNMATAISKIGTDLNPDGVSVLGVCEIENRQVLEDLIKMPQIADRNYSIVHYESPDRRGIDVALLYRPDHFKLESSKNLKLYLENDTNFRTRSQLLVTGELLGERMHFMVAHWPSRRGGEKRSRPKRVAAAELGKSVIDSISRVEANAKIIYMGDLNDDPNNASLRKGMKAVGEPRLATDGRIYNPMEKLWKEGIGSLGYKDNWNLFDQMLVTSALVETGSDFTSLKLYKPVVFNDKMLINPEGQYKSYPKRTYSWGTWVNGYSDHFPVYLTLIKEKK